MKLLLEQVQMEEFLSGKESFRNFLYLINKFDLRFLKKSYLNTDKYYYFFYTESIQNNKMLKDELELKESLRASYLTFKQMKKRKISFYFGIIDDTIEYGFYDVSRRVVYKTGKFTIEKKYFNNLPRHKCFKGIRNRLVEADLKNMEKLHSIKEDFKNFMDDGEIKIMDENQIKFQINKENLENLDEKELKKELMDFKSEFEWGKLVTPYVIIGENKVHFYLKLKSDELIKIGY
jgi:hypothetical protein